MPQHRGHTHKFPSCENQG